MVHISDESIAEVRRVSEWHAEQQEREESEAASNTEVEGEPVVDLMVAIMAANQRASEWTLNRLVESGYTEALDVMDQFIRFYKEVNASAAVTTTRQLEWALSGVSLPWLVERREHLAKMAQSMGAHIEAGF